MTKKNGNLEIWSLFSGAMGLDLGFEQAGLGATLAVEIDKGCCETMRLNRPALDIIEGSVCDLSADDLRRTRNYSGDVFMMVGGPPCQSFSSGGKRAALSDSRGNMIYEYMRLLGEVRPRFFLLENVANLVTAALRHRPIKERPGKHWSLKAYEKGGRLNGNGDAPPLEADEMSGSAVRQMLADFDRLGYRVSFSVVDAADYGSAQHRLRFVMVGSRDGQAVPLADATHGPAVRKRYRTVRDAIADLAKNPGAHSVYTEQVARYFELVPEGGNWRDLPDHLQREAMGASYEAGGGKTGFYRRLAWDAPSPTVTGRANRKASAICHPSATRPVSVKECARLQGFPDDWQFSGSMAAQYLQIGNAVPVELGRAYATAMKRVLEKKPLSLGRPMEVETMLDRAVKRLRASARNKRSQEASLSLFEGQAA